MDLEADSGDSDYDVSETGSIDTECPIEYDVSSQDEDSDNMNVEFCRTSTVSVVTDSLLEQTMIRPEIMLYIDDSATTVSGSANLSKVEETIYSSSCSSKRKIQAHKIGYFDHGDPTYSCEFCGALFWYAQRINKRRRPSTPIYTGCCMRGQVQLPFMRDSPELLWLLLTNDDEISRHFKENIRAYNMLFAFTSIGGKVDRSIKKVRGPNMFGLQGQNYHLMGSLKPIPGDYAKFSQMYIVDTENEIQNRLNVMSKGKVDSKVNTRNKFRGKIIEIVIKLLDEFNPHVKSFRCARDRFNMEEGEKFQMRIISKRERDGRMYCEPTVSECAALIPGDFVENMEKRDIIVEEMSGKLKRIDELHLAYLALQYPILFVQGEDGFRVGIKKLRAANRGAKSNQNISMRQWFAFRLQERDCEKNILLRSKRLLQQFIVDGYTMIESNRLRYVSKNQTKMRSTTIARVKAAKASGSTNLSNYGKSVAIPKSFTGGPRYMRSSFMDAMAICKTFGYPDLFITFTCNPKWPEITRYVQARNLKADDRPDIITKMFHIKLQASLDDLTNKQMFGKTISVMYTVEFQKRGLPHAHILLFMAPGHKLLNTDQVDRVITAEIPDKIKEKELYEVVQECMIHGPCGRANPNSPCMVNGKCTKFFPKKYANHSTLDKNGFPIYRRRDSGKFVEKCGIKCDNRYVIPYNKKLSLRYRAHINVEWCNQTGSIKYLFKYVTKGPDRVTISVEPIESNCLTADSIDRNEVKDWFDCRYVSACEAAWRIFGYDIHYLSTPVVKLFFHEEGKQPVYYKEDDIADDVIGKFEEGKTQFLAWFELNKSDYKARALLYEEIPNFYTWEQKSKVFKRRKITNSFAIGRINYVPKKIEEAYYLRMLVSHQRGPTCFADLRTVKGEVYDTYRDACFGLGLLDDDREYIAAIEGASFMSSGHSTRRLFVNLLISDSFSKADEVWTRTWKFLAEDITYKIRKEKNIPDLELTDDELKRFTLLELEKLLLSHGSSLSQYESMPNVEDDASVYINQLIVDERKYNRVQQTEYLEQWLPKATTEQKKIYEEILEAVGTKKGGFYFVSGFGGTGKTFLWKLLSAALRSKGDIVLNVASSGIAALLLEGGRTAHSRFCIPITVDEFSTCSFTRGSEIGDLVTEAKLIIWDEAPMTSKYCFEALDRSLSDLMRCKDDIKFGGKVVVLGGDYRQILPVISGGGRQETVFATINSSYLWAECKVLHLTKNMRLLADIPEGEKQEIEAFSEWLLAVGDGRLSLPNDGVTDIDIPEDHLILNVSDPIEAIIEAVYGKSGMENYSPQWFKERAIMCPKNDDVNTINNLLMERLDGEERIYLSSDSIDPTDQKATSNPVYTPDFLNNVRASGLPNHSLRLRVGCPVMLLRNIDPSGGLCNGTRLQITQMADHVIEARVLTGTTIGDKVLIPRMLISPSDSRIQFKMRRRQFPLTVSFAITINKSQGQTLTNAGIYLPNPVFSHGQLYVALSRVSSKRGLKILITDRKGKPETRTKNVVFKEVFSNVGYM